MSRFKGDSVEKTDGAWWFWDEVWAYRDGPFQTEEAARERLKEYCERELGGSK